MEGSVGQVEVTGLEGPNVRTSEPKGVEKTRWFGIPNTKWAPARDYRRGTVRVQIVVISPEPYVPGLRSSKSSGKHVIRQCPVQEKPNSIHLLRVHEYNYFVQLHPTGYFAVSMISYCNSLFSITISCFTSLAR